LATSSASNKHQTKLPTWPARVLPSLPPGRCGIHGNTSPPINGQDQRPMAGAVIRANSQGQTRADTPPTQSRLASSAARRRSPPAAAPPRSAPRAAVERGHSRRSLPRGSGGRRSARLCWAARADRSRGGGAELSAAPGSRVDLVGERKLAASPRWSRPERLLRSAAGKGCI
jgi:hypothetical protein